MGDVGKCDGSLRLECCSKFDSKLKLTVEAEVEGTKRNGKICPHHHQVPDTILMHMAQ